MHVIACIECKIYGIKSGITWLLLLHLAESWPSSLETVSPGGHLCKSGHAHSTTLLSITTVTVIGSNTVSASSAINSSLILA